MVESILVSGKIVYGVNTGFGKLAEVRIPPDQLDRLQLNLLRSHACGVGDPFPEPSVRAMLLLRANVLASGYAGCRTVVVDRLLALDAPDIDVEQIKWVVLMVLFSQPGQELAYARMEDLVFEETSDLLH